MVKQVILLILIGISFILNIFGLMKLIPIYVTSPILFVCLLIFIHSLFTRHRFKGFQR
ncbi:hypothetical protein [Rossellomorea marisflavi]|uniref:hypothetical protein n=1 Tax=Rossellomorea marisflavi TaxID=189381 RepID=UPI003FA16107